MLGNASVFNHEYEFTKKVLLKNKQKNLLDDNLFLFIYFLVNVV